LRSSVSQVELSEKNGRAIIDEV